LIPAIGAVALTLFATRAESAMAPSDPPLAATPSPAPAPPSEVSDENLSAIIVTARPRSDPLQGINIQSYELTQKIDNAVVGPLASAYQQVLPRPARLGLHNLIRNIGEPVVFINFLLQLKPGKATETLGRFTINTTIGLAGLIDVARHKPFKLPYRHNGFANTLGYYGVKPGAYFFLPGIGPTTLRDVLGGLVDGLLLPMGIGTPFNKTYYTLPNGAIRSLDRRVEFDCQLKVIRSSSDPYAAARAYYLDKRQAEIEALHGRGSGAAPAAKCQAETDGVKGSKIASAAVSAVRVSNGPVPPEPVPVIQTFAGPPPVEPAPARSPAPPPSH